MRRTRFQSAVAVAIVTVVSTCATAPLPRPNPNSVTVASDEKSVLTIRVLSLFLQKEYQAAAGYFDPSVRPYLADDALKQAWDVARSVIDDVASAYALLAETDRVDASRIVILGHSLGGMLIPRIAGTLPTAAGFIVMAGPTRPFPDLILDQIQYIYGHEAMYTDFEQQQIDALTNQVQKIKSPSLGSESADEILLGAPPSYWLDLRGYDPAPKLPRW